MKRTAFTLIELLVVIAIIALLVSILMPSLQKAKEMARDVHCMSNLHHISTAIHMYLSDHDGQFPYNAWGHNNGPEAWTSWQHRVGIVPRDHVEGNTNLAKYPGLDRVYRQGYIDWAQSWETPDAWKCLTANAQIEPKWLGGFVNHYGMNDSLIGTMQRQPPWRVHCFNVEDFPAELHLVSDGHIGFWGGNQWSNGGLYFWDSLQLNPWWYAYNTWPLQLFIDDQPNEFKGHTGQRANVARINGSVAAERELTWEDFMVRWW